MFFFLLKKKKNQKRKQDRRIIFAEREKEYIKTVRRIKSAGLRFSFFGTFYLRISSITRPSQGRSQPLIFATVAAMSTVGRRSRVTPSLKSGPMQSILG